MCVCVCVWCIFHTSCIKLVVTKIRCPAAWPVIFCHWCHFYSHVCACSLEMHIIIIDDASAPSSASASKMDPNQSNRCSCHLPIRLLRWNQPTNVLQCILSTSQGGITVIIFKTQNHKPRCIPAVYCKNLYNVVERICNPVQCDAAVSHTLLLSLWCHWTYLWPCSHCSALVSLQCTGKAKENGLTWSLWCAGSPRPKCPALAKSAGGHNAEKVDTRADRPAEPG